MTTKESATRAEISDIANAVIDGTDAVMLSEESAMGKNPRLAVKTMSQTIIETEKIYKHYKEYKYSNYSIQDAVDKAAVNLSKDIKCSGILTLTNSGNSPRSIAKYRPKEAIYAIAHEDLILKQLTLSWGVYPAFIINIGSIESILKELVGKGVDSGIIDFKKVYTLIAGVPAGVSGSSNVVRVLKEVELRYFYS